MDNITFTHRTIAWFSCGASSAVAAKLALAIYPNVEIVNIVMPDEDEDNRRFLVDVEQWIGRDIIQIRSDKYANIEDVFYREKYISGVHGAACTKRLKRMVQDWYRKPDDRSVIGFTADERLRIDNLVERRPGEHFLWPLAERRITKEICFSIIQSAGIELPRMYKLGYNHANCIGCVKGGRGYWNKIRVDFPEVFASRARMERIIGFQILRGVWLDELDPADGRNVPLPPINCGLLCEGYNDLVNP